MKRLTWVVGRGGLLGSSVERALEPEIWRPDRPFPWGDPLELQGSMAEAVRAFAARLERESWDSWCLYWCSGRGVVGTAPSLLDAETATLRLFLDHLGSALAAARVVTPGHVFLASSAGGVYGGSAERPLVETTATRPLSDYGRAKLAQEDALRAWAGEHPTVSTLVGRLSNLYGPAQHLDKPQGLISQMSRCQILAVPVHIFVPLDTFRDYLFVEDAAKRITRSMARLEKEARAGAQHVLKIFAAESETTLSGLLGVFRRITRRDLRVVSGYNPIRSEQPVRLQFRSSVWTDEPSLAHTDLLEGVSRVHRHQLALFQAGKLAVPWVTAPLSQLPAN